MSKNKIEKNILRGLTVFGLTSFIYLVRKPPIKDWLLVFFLKGYISSIVDSIIVRKGYINYPVNIFKYFNISVLYDYLLFPLACVFYNQVTYKKKAKSILLRVLLFSLPMTIVEFFLERNTKLIKYKKGWNSLHTFTSLTLTFLSVRSIIQWIRNYSEKQST